MNGPYCNECRWARDDLGNPRYARCLHESAKEPTGEHMLAGGNRSQFIGRCGPRGKFFESKSEVSLIRVAPKAGMMLWVRTFLAALFRGLRSRS